jgi:hypothetical protein
MWFEGHGAVGRGITAAMSSRLGPHPARLRRRQPQPGYSDAVHLGAFRTEALRRLGGYRQSSGRSGEAELAWAGTLTEGVWVDPVISSTRAVRDGLGALFSRYRGFGARRLAAVRRHPASISPRDLAVPLLVAGLAALAGRGRRRLLAAYAGVVLLRGAGEVARDPAGGIVLIAALPTIHAGWGFGLLEGAVRMIGGRPAAAAA